MMMLMTIKVQVTQLQLSTSGDWCDVQTRRDNKLTMRKIYILGTAHTHEDFSSVQKNGTPIPTQPTV